MMDPTLCSQARPLTIRTIRYVRFAAFQQRLQQLSWTDGRNVRIDYRRAAGNAENYRKYAAELVALAPDVILAPGGSFAPMLQATHTARPHSSLGYKTLAAQ